MGRLQPDPVQLIARAARTPGNALRTVLASCAVRAARLAFIVVLLAARPAGAIPYEAFIDIDDQADLDDLLAAQDITQDTYDELLELLESGVDLNTADRAQLYGLPNLTYDDVDKIIAFRSLQKGGIREPSDLVAAGALSQEKLLAISPFLVVRPPGDDPLNVHGWVRLMTRFTIHDGLAPPGVLRSRLTAMKHLQAGIAITGTRLVIGDPVYDPNRDALIAENKRYRAHVPKAFVKWEDDRFSVIGGSYRAGFAQRLIFDNARQYSPNGLYADDDVFYTADLTSECKESAGELAVSPCDGDRGAHYVTPDFISRSGLFGLGAGAKHLELGTGWLQAYGWASAEARAIYQYELFVPSKDCPDPHDDTNPACAAPTVFVRPDDAPLLTPTSRYAFATLPNVFGEKLVGGNVSYFADRRNSIGATAYGATETSLVKGLALDFQEWSRLPTGRTFGAAGANFSFGRGWLDVFGEAGVSFDKTPDAKGPASGGGGPAGILRITATKKREELEAVFRYYSIDYANPFARPISAPDEFDGQRARDELGGRLRYVNTGKRFTLRALLDLWVPPSTMRADSPAGHTQPKVDTYVRGDVRTTDELRLGLWLRYQDKDLNAGGHAQCFEVATDTSTTGEPIPCSGRQLTTIATGHYQIDPTLGVTVMLEHQLLDDKTLSPTAFRQDLAAWAIALWHPDRAIRIRGRVRYLDTAIEDDTYLERSISGVVDAAFQLRGRDTLRLRVDAKAWLDARESTMVRVPNPELQLWLSYEARL